MLESIVFYTLAAFIIMFGVLVVTARNTVHSVLFLVANFLCVAVIYVMLAAEFLAIIQILVYAGGIVVLYLFVVMLVNLKRPPEAAPNTRRQSRLGFAIAAVMLAEIAAILVYSAARPASAAIAASAGQAPAAAIAASAGQAPAAAIAASAGQAPGAAAAGNTQIVGMLLYTDYLVPFEVASMLLLVAMIGAILLAKKEI